MIFYDPAADGQAQPRTLGFAVPEVCNLLELFKYFLLFIGMDAGTVVSHLNPDFSFLEVKADNHLAFFRGAEFCRIGQQVDQDLDNPPGQQRP